MKLLSQTLGEDRIKRNVDISEHLYTRLGGVAQAFYIATTGRELVVVLEICQELKLPYLVLGSGSKVALSNLGMKGVIIKNRSDNLRVFGIKGKVSRDGIGIEEAFLEAESGVSLVKLADFARKQGLGGLEVVNNLPGTVGGSFFINIVLRDKAYQTKVLTLGGELKDKLPSQVINSDIILSVIFKLKSSKL